MAPQRKFDWAEAQRLRRQGWTYTRIAERLGVSYQAVRFACDARARNMAALLNFERQRQGTCCDCGTQISSNAAKPAKRCWQCASLHRATSVRETTLRCVSCGEWRPDNDFPYSRSARPVWRGRHSVCRACQTIVKRAYRARLKQKAAA